jgi:hypothetical protein
MRDQAQPDRQGDAADPAWLAQATFARRRLCKASVMRRPQRIPAERKIKHRPSDNRAFGLERWIKNGGRMKKHPKRKPACSP